MLSPAIVAPTRGLYVGSTLAPNWLERITVGDIGFRSKAVLTRYPEGILVERSGATPIWIPQDAITAIRWRLPSGTEIDTGFRGDDRSEYARWIGEAA